MYSVLQVDTALEGVEQTDLGQYLSLAEQYKPLLGPGHYQLVIIRCVYVKLSTKIIYSIFIFFV